MTNSSKSINGLAKACSVSVALSAVVPGAWGEDVAPRTRLGDSAVESLGKVLNVGPFEIRPHLGGSILYDDNIQITKTDPQEDVVWTISPGLLIGAGEYRGTAGTYVAVDYTPTIILFTDHEIGRASCRERVYVLV